MSEHRLGVLGAPLARGVPGDVLVLGARGVHQHATITVPTRRIPAAKVPAVTNPSSIA
ncbi:hypothetical protein ACIHAR_01925 [Streptomyces sp. NPDC052016]|uniref:hypothetical protein n=1 Tax=Streptomyces sp. NPDC052016 TaxID=3365680 RepID=UPI0037D26510